MSLLNTLTTPLIEETHRPEPRLDPLRQAIAEHLHDEVCGPLLAVLHDLHWITEHSPQNIRARAQVAQQTLTQAMRTSQALMFDVNDSPRADLREQLSELMETLALRANVDINVVLPQELDRLTPLQGNVCLRFVREAASNVLRHAGASRAELYASIHDRCVVLQLLDNGKGLTPGLSDAGTASLGKWQQQHRAHLIGGQFNIYNRDTEPGVCAQLRFPIHADGQRP